MTDTDYRLGNFVKYFYELDNSFFECEIIAIEEINNDRYYNLKIKKKKDIFREVPSKKIYPIKLTESILKEDFKFGLNPSIQGDFILNGIGGSFIDGNFNLTRFSNGSIQYEPMYFFHSLQNFLIDYNIPSDLNTFKNKL